MSSCELICTTAYAVVATDDGTLHCAGIGTLVSLKMDEYNGCAGAPPPGYQSVGVKFDVAPQQGLVVCSAPAAVCVWESVPGDVSVNDVEPSASSWNVETCAPA